MPQSHLAVPAVGFLTVAQSDSLGWTGGYLLLNAQGRPLEFHCTLPVRPSRAHEILYGRTFRSHLIQDVLAPPLLRQGKTPPQLLCTDLEELLGFEGAGIEIPVAQILDGSSLQATCDQACELPLPSAGFLRVFPGKEDQVRSIIDRFRDLVDWSEPLMRIREAIREAQSHAVLRAA